jgi:hypothetical protein
LKMKSDGMLLRVARGGSHDIMLHDSELPQ